MKTSRVKNAILITLASSCAILILFLVRPALSGRVKGLTKALEQLPPEDLLQVLENLEFAPVPKTGQTTSYAPGDDGDLQKGVSWPDSRFTDNGDGTVTDNLTGLVWTRNANLFGQLEWEWEYDETYPACGACNALADDENIPDGEPKYGLTDGSQPGDWRLPNVRELPSLVDYGVVIPALPAGHPFMGVEPSPYWSSTTRAVATKAAWYVDFSFGYVDRCAKGVPLYVWCVRGGP